MNFSALFQINGVSAITRPDFTQQYSSVNEQFRIRADIAHGSDAFVSVPVGNGVFTCQLPFRNGEHGEDAVLGMDWLERYRTQTTLDNSIRPFQGDWEDYFLSPDEV